MTSTRLVTVPLPPPPTCPEWCQGGHDEGGWDDFSGDGVARSDHTRQVAGVGDGIGDGVSVEVVQVEYGAELDKPAGVPVPGREDALVWVGGEAYTVDGARRLAAAIVAAADLADKINGL